MKINNNVKVLVFVSILFFTGFWLAIRNKKAIKQIYDLEFNGVVQVIDYDQKGFPTVEVANNNYYLSLGYNFEYKIQQGDSIFKKRGSFIVVLKKKNTGAIFKFDR